MKVMQSSNQLKNFKLIESGNTRLGSNPAKYVIYTYL